MKYRFIAGQRHRFSVPEMCRVLGVCRSAFYVGWQRPASAHAMRDEALKVRITTLFESSRCLYGSPRLHRELQAEGINCSEKRVARLMRELQLVARPVKRYVATTDSGHRLPVAPNRLNREYQVQVVPGLNRVWAGDITYIPTAQGWLYLAVVLDLKSRRVIGWSMARTLEQGLVQEALKLALGQRRERGPARREDSVLLFHSDRGSQYAGGAFQEQLQEASLTGSMSRKGNCWDNAPVESFFATLKKELIHQEQYQTREQARVSLYEYIEVFYNRVRRHSALGYLSPADYELSLI